jgi:hypothetical protein
VGEGARWAGEPREEAADRERRPSKGGGRGAADRGGGGAGKAGAAACVGAVSVRRVCVWVGG